MAPGVDMCPGSRIAPQPRPATYGDVGYLHRAYSAVVLARTRASPAHPPSTGRAMDHEPVLISTIAIGLTAAFIGGLIARHLRLPAIVGYIVAGVVIGPFTPGLHRRHRHRPRARRARRHPADVRGRDPVLDPRPAGRALDRDPGRARPDRRRRGLLGVGSARRSGWGLGGGLVLGLALSVASTVVLLRALTDRGELDTPQGRIAVGWLIVEDLLRSSSSSCCRRSPRSWAVGAAEPMRRRRRRAAADRPRPGQGRRVRRR